jgi:hypothetical protein
VDWELKEISRILLLRLAMLAAIFLSIPYEPVLEVAVALAFVAAVLLCFLLHPRKEVFYVRTTGQLRDPDRNPILEHDDLAVKAELTRLWLLFLPTLLAVGFIVVSSASGSLNCRALAFLGARRAVPGIVPGMPDFTRRARIQCDSAGDFIQHIALVQARKC